MRAAGCLPRRRSAAPHSTVPWPACSSVDVTVGNTVTRGAVRSYRRAWDVKTSAQVRTAQSTGPKGAGEKCTAYLASQRQKRGITQDRGILCVD